MIETTITYKYTCNWCNKEVPELWNTRILKKNKLWDGCQNDISAKITCSIAYGGEDNKDVCIACANQAIVKYVKKFALKELFDCLEDIVDYDLESCIPSLFGDTQDRKDVKKLLITLSTIVKELK